MAKKKKNPRNRVVHGLSKYRHAPDFYTAVLAIYNGVSTDTADFHTPDPSAATVKVEIDKLSVCITAAVGHAPGTVDARGLQQEVVLRLMDDWCAYVQKCVNEDPARAAILAAAAGMYLQPTGSRTAQTFMVEHGEHSGTIQLFAPPNPGGRGSHNWEISTNGKDFTLLGQSTQADFLAKNLTPAVTYYFRHQSVGIKGTSDWSAVLSIIAL